MSKNWEEKTLGDLFDITSSKRVFKSDWVKEGVPFYRAREIVSISQGKKLKDPIYVTEQMYQKYVEKYGKPEPDDILVTGVGTLGICYVVKEGDKFYFKDGNIIWLKNKSKVNSRFIEYFFKTEALIRQIKSAPVGATVGTFTIIRAKETIINLPPLSEQKRVVEILDEKFEAIEKLKKVTEAQIKDAKQLFESRLNEIFQIQDGSDIRFDEVCILQRGFDFPTRLRSKGEYPLVSANGITDYVNKFKVSAPGVTTGRSGSIGFVHFVDKDFWPLNTALYIKDFKGNNEKFVYYFLKQFDLSRFVSGAGVPTLNRNNVHSVIVRIPDKKSDQIAIVKELDNLWEQLETLKNIYQIKLDELQELKKSYLEKAFAGKL